MTEPKITKKKIECIGGPYDGDMKIWADISETEINNGKYIQDIIVSASKTETIFRWIPL